MISRNEIITAMHLEYEERQIVIYQLKFSTRKQVGIINKPGQFLSAENVHYELLSTETDSESNQYQLGSS
jgi:hypothetical protein